MVSRVVTHSQQYLTAKLTDTADFLFNQIINSIYFSFLEPPADILIARQYPEPGIGELNSR